MSSLSMPFNVTFCKTPAGRAEVAQRKRGLSSRQRMALILIDGRKRLAELAIAVPPDELVGIGSHLMGLGLIEPVHPVEAAPPVVAVEVVEHVEVVEVLAPVEEAQPVQPAQPAQSAISLAEIKEMLTRSAESYLGLMAADVVRRVQKASDETELMRAAGHWHMAMRESKYGKDVASALLEEVKASLRGSTPA